MIKAVSISRSFGTVQAVKNVTLEIREGEVFTLLGPNGAGKTTTIRMLTGLIAPTSGVCTINDIDVTKNPMLVHRSVGVQPEVPGHYESLTAIRNLEFYAKLFSVRNDTFTERAKTLLDAFDLWDRRGDTVQTYSKGMKQKLAIVRALIHDPKYIFLDEPMTGLDPVASRTVKGFILELKNRGKTVVLSTHNLDDAERLSDRVAVIKGNILALDTSDKLRDLFYKRTVVFHLKGADDRILPKLRGLSFINSAERSENKLIVQLENPEEDNPKILALIVKEGYLVQFVGEIRHSLEDIYLKLVKEERN